MKNGSTHLVRKVEHAVDLETGAGGGCDGSGTEEGDTTTMVETLVTAAEQVVAVSPEAAGVAEVVADKGCHSNETMVDLAAVEVRSYLAKPDRAAGAGRTRRRLGPRAWKPVSATTGQTRPAFAAASW